MRHQHLILLPALAVLGLSLTSCQPEKSEASADQGAPQVFPAVFLTVEPESLVIESSQPGRLSPYRQAEVRARVPGIVLTRPYEEGQEVAAGTVLFEIDPAPLKASFDAAVAALDEAKVRLELAEEKQSRYKKLGTTSAVSVLDVKEVESQVKQEQARIASAQATVDSARLRLEYATVVSPIDGRARKAEVTEGALVGEGSATLLTTVDQIDPIYVNFSQPVSEVVALRRALNSGHIQGVKADEIAVELIMGDGSVYPDSGKLIFSDLAVDEGTDTVQMRALMPNAGRELFPGMFVRVKMKVAEEKEAILVPRDAVLRSNDGAIVMSINEKNEVVPIPIQTKEIHGNRWHVTSGLKGGERIIVVNPAFAPVGAVVSPIPADAPPPEAPAPATENPAESSATGTVTPVVE